LCIHEGHTTTPTEKSAIQSLTLLRAAAVAIAAAADQLGVTLPEGAAQEVAARAHRPCRHARPYRRRDLVAKLAAVRAEVEAMAAAARALSAEELDAAMARVRAASATFRAALQEAYTS